jgi:hypothetical protein
VSRKIKQNKISLYETFQSLTEVFNSDIPTNFKTIDYGDYIAYNFKTNSGLEYDLEFHYTEERCDTLLSNNKTLGDLLPKKCIDGFVQGFDVAFTLTTVEDKNNPEEFEKETNKHEYIELFGRMNNIIKKVINKHSKYSLFVVGHSKRNKNEIYQKLIQNHFKNEFDLFKGVSQYHPTGESLFIVRK